MSYLSTTRLSFRGRFLSDVSTRNNVEENYAPGAQQQNLWNVAGGASVELLDCRALTTASVAADDPASGYVITGAFDRPSGKMVDLDPAWQMSSEIWGMRLRVIDPDTGALAVEGTMAVCAFRDLWTRQLDPQPNRQPAGARFVSTLSDLTWGPATEQSAALTGLRTAAEDTGKLSVGWHTFAYFYPDTEPRYRTGSVMVHLGPHLTGEPGTVLVHRRLTGFQVQPQGGGRPFAVTSDMDFAVSGPGTTLHMDVGHGLLLDDVDGRLAQFSALPGGLNTLIGLSIGLLPAGDPPLFSPHPTPEVLLDIPTDPDWYRETGGVVDIAVDAGLAARVPNTRIALFARFTSGNVLLVAKETDDGVFCRADGYVCRLDPGQSATVRFHTRKFGEPLQGAQVHLAQVLPGAAVPAPTLSQVPPTGADGTTELTLTGTDPGNPRSANGLDGDIFAWAYSPKQDANGQPDINGVGLGGLDVVVTHGRDPFAVPAAPVFESDVKPFMAQYAQLYPIMSEHLFDIADYDALVQNRQAMLLAFSRSIEDPNYMPVTRDMSQGRIDTLVKWLSDVQSDGTLRRGIAVAGAAPLTPQPEMAAAIQEDVKQLMATLARRGAHLPVMPAEVLTE